MAEETLTAVHFWYLAATAIFVFVAAAYVMMAYSNSTCASAAAT